VAGFANSHWERYSESWNFSSILAARATEYFATITAVVLSLIYGELYSAVCAPNDSFVLYPMVYHT